MPKQSARAAIEKFLLEFRFQYFLHSLCVYTLKTTMENIIVPPHLNAEAYRNEFNISVSNAMPYLDYLRVHSDGTTLIGCSELTARYWIGGAKVIKSIRQQINVADTKLNITLKSGTADGCFLNKSNKILLCQDNGAVSIWGGVDGAWSKWEQIINVEEHDDSVMAVDCLNPDREYVTVGADGNIKVWDVNEMICETNYIAAHSRQISDVAVKPNSTSFATGSLDRHVSLWDKSSREKITDIATVDCGVRCLAWLDENHLLLGNEAGVLSLVEMRCLKTAQPLVTFPAPVHKILVQKGTKNVAVCCDNRILSVFEVSGNLTLNPMYRDVNKHTNTIRGMAWDNAERNVLHTVAWDNTLQTHVVKN